MFCGVEIILSVTTELGLCIGAWWDHQWVYHWREWYLFSWNHQEDIVYQCCVVPLECPPLNVQMFIELFSYRLSIVIPGYEKFMIAMAMHCLQDIYFFFSALLPICLFSLFLPLIQCSLSSGEDRYFVWVYACACTCACVFYFGYKIVGFHMGFWILPPFLDNFFTFSYPLPTTSIVKAFHLHYSPPTLTLPALHYTLPLRQPPNDLFLDLWPLQEL